MLNSKSLVYATLITNLFFNLDCGNCDVNNDNLKVVDKKNNKANNNTKSILIKKEDFGFTELKKIDFSKCRKINVQEIKTKFIHPIWFVKTESNSISIHITFKNEGNRSFYKTPYLLPILFYCIKDNVGSRGNWGFSKILKDNAIKLEINESCDDIMIDISCLVEHYELAVSLLIELLTMSHPTENDIERAKNYYLQNIKYQKVLPRWVAIEKLMNITNAPEYRRSFKEAVKKIPTYTKNDIEKCYKSLFDPRNAEITVVGNVTPEKLISEFNKVFGKIKCHHNNFKHKSCYKSEAPLAVHEHIEVDNENATVFLKLPNISLTNDNKFVIRLINRIFGRGTFDSKLWADIRERKHLVYGIWSYLDEFDLQNHFGIETQTSPKYIKATIDAIKSGLIELIEKGITEEELVATKTKLVASHVLGTPAEIISYVVQNRRDGMSAKNIDDCWEKYAKLTVADVNRVLKSVFDINKLVIVSAGRTVPQVAHAPYTAETQTHMPLNSNNEAHTKSNVTPISCEHAKTSKSTNKNKTVLSSNTSFQIEEEVLDNGLRIVVCKLPVNTGAIYFGVGYQVGSADDPRNIVGASHFLECMTFKESKNLPMGKMQYYLNMFNKDTNGYTYPDATYYPHYCNKIFLDANLKIEAERMHNAKILEETVEGEKNIILAERERDYEGLPYWRYAYEAIQKDLYLYSNYSYNDIGYRDQIKACNFENLKKHYETYYTPDNAVIIITGNITKEEAKELCQRNFGHIQRGKGIKRNRVIDPEDINISRKLVIKDANITQKMIFFYYKIKRSNIKTIKQEIVLSMIDEMLFKGETSILSQVLCKSNLGYDVYSHITKQLYDNAYLDFGFLLKNNKVSFDDAEKLVYKTIAKFLHQETSTNIKTRFEKLKQRFIYKYKLLLNNPETMNNFIFTELCCYGHTIAEIRDIINIVESISFDDFIHTAKGVLNESNKTLVALFAPIEQSK